MYPGALDVCKAKYALPLRIQQFWSVWLLSIRKICNIWQRHGAGGKGKSKAEVEATSCRTADGLLSVLSQPKSTIHFHLRQIGEACRAGLCLRTSQCRYLTIWPPRTEPTAPCKALLYRHLTAPFFDRRITGYEKWSCTVIRRGSVKPTLHH